MAVLEFWLSLACLLTALVCSQPRPLATTTELPPVLFFLLRFCHVWLSWEFFHYFSCLQCWCSRCSIFCPFLFPIYSPNGVIHLDVLNWLRYAGDSQICISISNFLPILRSVFLLPTGHVHMDSIHCLHLLNSTPSYLHNLHRLTS